MTLANLLMIAPVLLISLTVHEYAHGKVSSMLGDPTPGNAGRLTLNPIAHLDLLGAIVFFTTRRIGWAKPVPVNPMYYKDQRRGMLIVGLAGPVSNFLMALLATGALYYWKWIDPRIISKVYYGQAGTVNEFIFNMLFLFVAANIGLGIFNLLPFPPLDGSRVLAGVIPAQLAKYLDYLEGPLGMVIILLLAMTGYISMIVGPVIEFLIDILFMGLW